MFCLSRSHLVLCCIAWLYFFPPEVVAATAKKKEPLPDIEKLIEEDPSEVEGESMGESFRTMGKDFKQFGEKIAEGVERVIKKKTFDFLGDPWAIQGIPLVFQGLRTGFHLGVRVHLQDIRRQDPHKLSLEAQVLASDRAHYKHSLALDYPHAFDGKFRLQTRIAYDRDIAFRYYGIGNEREVDNRLIEMDSDYYENQRESPNITFSGLRYFGKYVRFGPTFGFKWMSIRVPSGGLLEQENPSGARGGRSHFLGLGIIYDTVDWEPYPSRGKWHEFYVNWYAPFIGSDSEFWRLTYTYRRFYPLHSTLIFAHRTMFESLIGDVPFFELGVVGGSDSVLAFGGDRYFRGYDSNRFVDQIRLVLGFELRWDPLKFVFYNQNFTVGFVPFFDIGRVWPTVLPLRLGNWHGSAGFGTRIIWNNRFIIRGDFATNVGGASAHLEIGNSF